MIDGSEQRNRQLAFELQNSHVCEKRSNTLYLSVNVQSAFSAKVLNGDSIVTSPTRDGSVILHSHSSHAKL